MRIALLTEGISPYVLGGIQRHSYQLAIQILRSDAELWLFHTVHVKDREAEARALYSWPDDLKGRVHNIFVEYPPKGSYPGHYIHDSLRYSERLLKKYIVLGLDVDFIYAQGQTGRSFIDAKKAGENLPPIGINAHGYEMFQSSCGVVEKLKAMMLRTTFKEMSSGADYVFSFSGKIKQIVQLKLNIPESKIIELPNAVEAAWVAPQFGKVNRPLKYIFVGRYERRKGLNDILQLLETETNQSYSFDFVGPLPNISMQSHHDLTFHGVVSDTAKLKSIISAADILVCPSYAEGMPTVILEAMARGLAVISTDVGAVSSMVSAKNGVLMEKPGIDSLRRAMQRLEDATSLEIEKMKESSLEKVTQFTWERVGELTLTAIESRIDKS